MPVEHETAVSAAGALATVLHDEPQCVNHSRDKEEYGQDQIEPEMQADADGEESGDRREEYGEGRVVNRVIRRLPRIPGRPATPYP